VAGLFYEDVLNGLAAAGVPFVVVGGVAVNLQGVPRFTADRREIHRRLRAGDL
jgi:hypothetical protein